MPLSYLPFVCLCLCIAYVLPELRVAMAYVACTGVALSVPTMRCAPYTPRKTTVSHDP